MTRPRRSVRWPLALGYAAVTALFGGLGTWSVSTEISGAVVAPATLKIEGERQIVQHPKGGVVSEIRARDGDVVRAGDVLLSLDTADLAAEFASLEQRLADARLRFAVLAAERDGHDRPEFAGAADLDRVSPGWLDARRNDHLRLFKSRLAAHVTALHQIGELKSRIGEEIDGVVAHRGALERQRALVREEEDGVARLHASGLVPLARLSGLRREEARLDGEIARLAAAAAEARARIAALDLEAERRREERREVALDALRQLGADTIALEERHAELVRTLAEREIRAPASGTVFGTRVFAPQSVVRAAEPLLWIVPTDRPFRLVARIAAKDARRAHAGQPAQFALAGLDRRDLPALDAEVLSVSADAVVDEATGALHYEAVLALAPGTLAALPDAALRPGMPGEVMLATGARRPLDYLIEPLARYVNRAFRDG